MFVNFYGGQLQVVHMPRRDGTDIHTDSYELQQTSVLSTSCHLFPDTSQMSKLQETTYWKIPGSRDIHEHWEGALRKTSTSRYSQAWESQ